MTVQELIDRLMMLPKDLEVGIETKYRKELNFLAGVKIMDSAWPSSYNYVAICGQSKHYTQVNCPECGDFVSELDIRLYNGVCRYCHLNRPKYEKGAMVVAVPYRGSVFTVEGYVGDDLVQATCDGTWYTFHEHELMPV